MALNGISTLATKQLRQEAKLDLAQTKRQAIGAPHRSLNIYDINLLPTKYNGNVIDNNLNVGGLQLGRPWYFENRFQNTALIIMTSTDMGQIAGISGRLTAQGFTTIDVIIDYALVPADLSSYGQVWDPSYNNATITPTVMEYYKTYLMGSGALCLIGEWVSSFETRDASIEAFMLTLGSGNPRHHQADGGGPLGQDTYYEWVDSVVQPEFLLSNSNASVVFDASGAFESIGTGTALAIGTTGIFGGTRPLTQLPIAVCWETGSLSTAPLGCVVVILDTNFLPGVDTESGHDNPNFTDNVIQTLRKK